MEYTEKIHDYINEHRNEILKTLKELVRIPSVRTFSGENDCHGKTCEMVLTYIEKLYALNGFETILERNGGYLLSYYGNCGKRIGIFVHADVVDGSDDWVYTTPFEPTEKDGYLIGRGVLDDKSAVVISLYCAKMLRELKLPFHSKLVMFTGSQEETGMADIEEYLKKYTAPDFALVADTAFPLYTGNKSGMRCWIRLNSRLCDIKDFSGGTAMNVTVGHACATLKGERLSEIGISHHSALPEGSVNAGYLLAKKILKRTDIGASDKKQMRLLVRILEKYYGETFEIEHVDEDCGRLTCTNGIIRTEDGRITLGIDIRYGISANVESIRNKMYQFCAENDCEIKFGEEKRGYILSKENQYVKACLKAYSDFTGDPNPKTNINAGGTYGRKLPCAAETGTTMRWEKLENMPTGHGGAHQPDECINIEGFFEALELTMHMILECDKIENVT